jgi:cyclopropane fatty-acyl-phospholipid synthase-like methyltransferase
MIFGSISFIVLIVLLILNLRSNDYRIWYLDLRKAIPFAENHASKVKEHYEENQEAYLKNYGKIIQAHRTSTEEELLEYIGSNARLEQGQTILDAGCGFGGPSLFFAKKFKARVEGLTLSASQVATMKSSIKNNGLEKTVSVIEGDYHQLEKYYCADKFDRILFLESLGHAGNIKTVIKGVNKVLKPGGMVYMKDFVKRELPHSAYDKEQIKGLKDMSEKFRYNTLDIYHTIYTLRNEGFDLVSIKEPDFITDNYEVNKSFALETGIVVGRPESFGVEWKYEYPPYVDPIELLFQKRTYKI